MSDKTSIEWTKNADGTPGATWNPVRGCTKVSPGCKHCYAETFAERWRGIAGHPYEQGFDPLLAPHKLADPLHWRKPRTVFVNSMSDLFQDFVPDDYIAACFGVMAATPHTYQALTKRAERLPRWFEWVDSGKAIDGKADHYNSQRGAMCIGAAIDVIGHQKAFYEPRIMSAVTAPKWPLPNVHLGVSVEDRKYGLPRIERLRRTPAALRFLSIEPLLEDLGELDLTGIGWVIVGGESGPGAREMDPAWARSIRDQCIAAGVPFFFKQWGGVRKKLRGRLLDGRTWDELPKTTEKSK